jgi:DNA-binding CsgD family transcriptional regulator
VTTAPSTGRRTTRVLAGVERLCHADLDARGLLHALAEHLDRTVPSDRLLVLRTDPATVLPTDGVARALPTTLCKPFWDNELLEDDYNKFAQLARGEIAATLLDVTAGEPTRSRRYVTTYRDLGVGDELRVAFTAKDGSCWGVAQLIRSQGASFDRAERDALAEVAPVIAGALRARFALGAPADGVPDGPAVVILDEAGRIRSVTAGAREWLAELVSGSATGMEPVAEPVYLVAARARAARPGGATEPACVQVRTEHRGWLHLHATLLEGPDAADGSVAVVMTTAQAPDLMPVFALGYRLTPREQDVLRFLARGMNTAEITRQLGISAHTVRDHVKSLFAKVGVRSRTELLARIFARHYFERLEADVERPDAVVTGL